MVFAAYTRATHALEWRLNVDLARALEVPIVLHLVNAGLSDSLARKLVGVPGPLRAHVEQQHQRVAAL